VSSRVELHQATTAVVVCLVSLIGYTALLGWDQKRTLGPDGYLHGPYEPWQVVALGTVVAIATGWAGWRRDGLIAASAATVTLTIVFSIDAATNHENDGLWPVGSFTVLVATFFGSWICTSVGADPRTLSRPRAAIGERPVRLDDPLTALSLAQDRRQNRPCLRRDLPRERR
jgi:hypothetical protein